MYCIIVFDDSTVSIFNDENYYNVCEFSISYNFDVDNFFENISNNISQSNTMGR